MVREHRLVSLDGVDRVRLARTVDVVPPGRDGVRPQKPGDSAATDVDRHADWDRGRHVDGMAVAAPDTCGPGSAAARDLRVAVLASVAGVVRSGRQLADRAGNRRT